MGVIFEDKTREISFLCDQYRRIVFRSSPKREKNTRSVNSITMYIRFVFKCFKMLEKHKNEPINKLQLTYEISDFVTENLFSRKYVSKNNEIRNLSARRFHYVSGPT